MRQSRSLSLLRAAFLFIALATARPDGNSDMNTEAEDTPQSYFTLCEHSGSLLTHIILEAISWCFVLPVAVMLSIVHSRYTIPVQFVFLIINAIALLCGIIYNKSTPDLYENNAHHKIGWIVTSVMCIQVVISLIHTYSGNSRSTSGPDVVSTRNMTDHQRPYSSFSQYHRSSDSFQVNIYSTIPQEEHFCRPGDEEEADEDIEMPTPLVRGLLRNRALDKFFTTRTASLMSDRALRVLQVVYSVIDHMILPFSFATVSTGIVTYSGIFKGSEIFNGMAHFIKGGIFFWYGLVVLGRYMGCWANFGWSWNLKPAGSRAVTGEFVESALIFIYGSTNVFLEHLAGWGKAWTAQDLEHVSISVMFLGGGLCGLLLESKRIRKWLRESIGRTSTSLTQQDEEETSGISFNPMPLLIIFSMGIMMSGHKQQHMVSRMVHKQWGNLLSGAAMARAVTYIITYIKPPTSCLPTRPLSELVGAFCLISGGLVFMSSARDIVEIMDRYDLDAMFTFNVSVGLSCFIMAYEIMVLAIKAWAIKESVQHAHSWS